MYCSKECQKAAWPTHKPHCRVGGKLAVNSVIAGNSTRGRAPHGFRSLQAFCDAVGDFIESHLWAWQAIAKILVDRQGGIAWSQTPPKFLMIHLAPTPMLSRPRVERNPATTFVLVNYQFWDIEAFNASVPRAAEQWADTDGARRLVEESHRSNRLYAGVLPVLFEVTTAKFMSMPHYVPQFNPMFTRPSRSTRFMQELMCSVLALCVDSINSGFPLRAANPAKPSRVLPGQFTHAPDTSWTWHALYSNAEDYQTGGHEGYDAAIEKIDPLLPLPDLMTTLLVF